MRIFCCRKYLGEKKAAARDMYMYAVEVLTRVAGHCSLSVEMSQSHWPASKQQSPLLNEISSKGDSDGNREKKMERYYDDMGAGKGNCTVGYGHLVHRNPCTPEELVRKVVEKDIMDGFNADVRAAEHAVSRNVKIPLTQEQFNALVSYTFNRGPSGARKAFKLINDGDFSGAAGEISSHVTATVTKRGRRVASVARGLFGRRAEESAPFKDVANKTSHSVKK